MDRNTRSVLQRVDDLLNPNLYSIFLEESYYGFVDYEIADG